MALTTHGAFADVGVDFLRGSTSMPRASFSTLPPELLYEIFDHARPFYDRPPSWTGKVKAHTREYVAARRAFASLALVSRMWRPFVMHYLFAQLVLVAPEMHTALPQLLETYGSLVRTIVVEASNSPSTPDASTDTARYELSDAALAAEILFLRHVDECFALAPRLKAVEVYGAHSLFDRRASIYVSAPERVRRLRWQCESAVHSEQNQEQLCEALARLAPQLQQLEVEGCYDFTLCGPPHLPQTFPRLEHLSLNLGNPRVADLLELIDRASAGPDDGCTIRRLDLRSVLTLGQDEIVALLRRNQLGTQLTSLQISLWKGFRAQKNIFDFPCVLLDLCPRLEHFSYMTSCTARMLAHLPRTIKSLELGTLPPGQPPSPIYPAKPLLDYLASPRAAQLRALCLVRRCTAGGGGWKAGEWESFLETVETKCKEMRVAISWKIQT